MKVIGIVGSTRPKGNTSLLVEEALAVCRQEGLETQIISLHDKRIEDCKACRHCSNTPGDCSQKDDLPAVYRELKTADGLILASPVYFTSITGKMKSFIDRIGLLSGSEGRVFQRKAGGSITVARRAGQVFAFNEMNNFLLHQGMIVPGSTYWNVAFGREPGEAASDSEGINTVRNFAANLAWLMKKLNL